MIEILLLNISAENISKLEFSNDMIMLYKIIRQRRQRSLTTGKAQPITRHDCDSYQIYKLKQYVMT